MKNMWNQTMQGKAAIGHLSQMINHNYLNKVDLFFSLEM